MSQGTISPPARFGGLLGLAPGNVPVYSSDYDSAADDAYPNRAAYRHYLDGMFMGYKWQCVEFARRWLYINKGYVFDNIAMAYDIFELRSVRRVHDNTLLPLHAFPNGCTRRPEPGCMLIWAEGGEFEDTGHVAIVTEVFDDAIRFVEQNYEHHPWPEGQTFSRELRVTREADGGYLVHCANPKSRLLGWVVQTDDASRAIVVSELDPQLLDVREYETPRGADRTVAWLDVGAEDEAAYVLDMEGHRLGMNDADSHRYYGMTESAFKAFKHAANELHAMFMHATHYVLSDDRRLARFNIPESLWPRLHQSWDNRRNQMITGRLDFSVSSRGIKVYEYNADSASCYMECGKVQGKWATSHGIEAGYDPGSDVYEDLVDAWQESGVDGVIHVMQDDDPEETYHALYMKSAMEEAGLDCRLIEGLDGLGWNAAGEVVDGDGTPIRWVWKTWAWETALEEIRVQLDDDARRAGAVDTSAGPRLADVLLRKGVMVFEPFWTAIPSNKAILPILWELFPGHPNLLETRYELTDGLQRAGYVSKPIGGRLGLNVSIVDRARSVVTETGGRFDNQPQIFQALFALPKVGEYYLQHSAFMVDGHFSGACVRVDPTLVISGESDVLALRVVDDSDA